MARSRHALLLVALFGCNGSIEQVGRETLEPSVLMLSLPEQLAPALRRPAALFDHGKHSAALQQVRCGEPCHLRSAKGALIVKFAREEDGEDRDALMSLYHDRCLDCHMRRRRAGQATGPVTCGECHRQREPRPSARLAMTYDYSLHARHVHSLGDKCGACHHALDKGTRKPRYVKEKEESCRTCHGEKAIPGGARSLRMASHGSCVGCHLDRKEADKKTGPVLCVGCHRGSERRAITRLTTVPRLVRKQHDRIQLRTAGGKAAPVHFDHRAHEARARFCSTCHHETSLKPCRQCHTLAGSEKGGWISLERALHHPISERSCVGCHRRATRSKACAGCHHADALGGPPSPGSCTVCHAAASSADTAAAPPAGDDTSAAPPVTVLTPRLPELPGFSKEQFPWDLTVGAIAKHYSPAKLPHGKLVLVLDRSIRTSKLASAFHREVEVVCRGCHHHAPPGSRPAPCRSCHGSKAHPNRDKPDLLTAYHRQCVGCHQRMKLKTGCTDCHKSASKEVHR